MTPMQMTRDHVVGGPNKHRYLDAVGKPLKVGDVIAYATARSSSIYQNFARVLEIKDTNEPVYMGWAPKRGGSDYNPRLMSWDYAYELKVEYLEYDHFYEVMKRKDIYESGVGYRPATEHDKPRTNTIKRVDRVIRLDLDVE